MSPLTADETPIPAAPTPYTHEQAAAVWGANALTSYPDEAAIPAQLGQVAAAVLTPDSPTLPPADHECGYEFREGLGYLAVDPNCPICCEQATAKWKSVWKR